MGYHSLEDYLNKLGIPVSHQRPDGSWLGTDDWKKILDDARIEYFNGCEVEGDSWELPCPSIDKFTPGNRVRCIVNPYGSTAPWTGTIIELIEHGAKGSGRQVFNVLVDHDGIGFDWMIPCGCSLRKLDEFSVNPSEAVAGVFGKMKKEWEKGGAEVEFFGTIEEVLDALDDE